MKIRTFGSFVGKNWFLFLLITAKLFASSEVTTFTGSDFLDIVVLILIITGLLYFGFLITGGEKVVKDD